MLSKLIKIIPFWLSGTTRPSIWQMAQTINQTSCRLSTQWASQTLLSPLFHLSWLTLLSSVPPTKGMWSFWMPPLATNKTFECCKPWVFIRRVKMKRRRKKTQKMIKLKIYTRYRSSKTPKSLRIMINPFKLSWLLQGDYTLVYFQSRRTVGGPINSGSK